jgi:hypothetical protein
MTPDQLVELGVKFREEHGASPDEIGALDAFVRCAVTGECD